MMPQMEARIDAEVAEWARRVPVDQIPIVLVFLAGRFLAERPIPCTKEPERVAAPERLLTAGALAEHLRVPESWVRTEERLRRIPGVRIGKYVRFRVSEVEQALAERKHPGAK
jgi:hypothetical protein